MKTNLLKKLYSQLCDYGLNSQEWVIQPVSESRCVIYHFEDPSFQFIGQIQQQAWKQIWLASL